MSYGQNLIWNGNRIIGTWDPMFIELPNGKYSSKSGIYSAAIVLSHIQREHPRAFKNLVRYCQDATFQDFMTKRGLGYKTLRREFSAVFDGRGGIYDYVQDVAKFWPGYYYIVDNELCWFPSGKCAMKGNHYLDKWNEWIMGAAQNEERSKSDWDSSFLSLFSRYPVSK